MSAVQQPRMTAAEYLEWERASDTRHEFFDGEIVDFAGSSLNHARIVVNIATELHDQTRSKDCELFTTEIRLRVGHAKAYTYPDIMIICEKPRVADDQKDTVLNPAIIMEVLSPSTALIDRVKKFHLYTSIPSLQEYLLVAQDSAAIEQYVRQADGKWLYAKIIGIESEIALPTLGCALKLADIYTGVEFPPPDANSDPTEGLIS